MGRTALSCAVVLWLGLPPAPLVRAAENDDRMAEASVVAADFLRTLVDGEYPELLELVTDPLTVEGQILKGPEQISGYFKDSLADTRAELNSHQDARIEVIGYQEALSRFGKPPKKFSHIPLKKCLFAAISYPKRRGFLLILKKHKKEGWRVTAVTD